MTEFRRGDPIRVAEFLGIYDEPSRERIGWSWVRVEGRSDRIPDSIIALIETDWLSDDVARDEHGLAWAVCSLHGPPDRCWMAVLSGMHSSFSGNPKPVGRLTRLVPEKP